MGTIIRNPACGSISDDGSCLKIEFNLVPVAFAMVVIGGTSMVGMSWIATGRVLVDDNEFDAESSSTNSNSNRNRLISPLSRVMRQNHDYERLQGIEEGTGQSSTSGGELEELVFET